MQSTLLVSYIVDEHEWARKRANTITTVTFLNFQESMLYMGRDLCLEADEMTTQEVPLSERFKSRFLICVSKLKGTAFNDNILNYP